MLSNNPVVITGIGSLSSLGKNSKELWESISKSKSGVSSLDSKFDGPAEFDFPVKIGSFISQDFEISEELLSKKEAGRFDRFVHYALHCAEETLKNSKIKIGTDYAPEKIGCIIGNGMGGFPYLEQEHAKFLKGSKARTSPFFIPAVIPNMASGMIGIKFGIKGVNYSISSACASSGHAIEAGILQIASGAQDAILVGGVEAVISKLTYGGFNSMKALSKRDCSPKEASCPFSKQRDGFVMGEGAGMLLLERKDEALKRGANILAEIAGHGSSCDAFHITAPHAEGLGAMASMNAAITNAGIKKEEINYINAHGTSTPMGDKIETKAIKDFFNDHAKELLVSSTKSMTGHLLGAAAGLESVICVLSLINQKVPPTINLIESDEDCDLNYVPNKMIDHNLNYVLNNSFGFGGTNNTIIFKKA